MKHSSMIFRSGDAFLPQNIRNFLGTFIIGNYSTPIYINYWSIVHMISGMFIAWITKFYGITYPYIFGFIIHTIWELWQVIIGMSRPYNIFGHNGIMDIIIDTGLFMLGMWLVITKNKLFSIDILEDIISF